MIRADPNWIGWPMARRNGALSCRSPLRIDSEREYHVFRAVKIDSVPSVTMKGGIRSRVTSRPFTQPHKVPTARPATNPTSTGMPSDDREPPHDDRGQHHDDAHREIDAGRQDDQRLGDPQDADDGHLQENGRKVRTRREARPVDRRAQDHAEEQDEEGDDGRIGVQETLDPRAERLLVLGERHRGRGARGDIFCSNSAGP